MKPIYVIDDSYAEYNENSNKKDPKFKAGSILEFQSIKIFLLKDMLEIGLKTFFVVSKIKNTVPWTYVINELNGEEII